MQARAGSANLTRFSLTPWSFSRPVFRAACSRLGIDENLDIGDAQSSGIAGENPKITELRPLRRGLVRPVGGVLPRGRLVRVELSKGNFELFHVREIFFLLCDPGTIFRKVLNLGVAAKKNCWKERPRCFRLFAPGAKSRGRASVRVDGRSRTQVF